MSTQKTFASLTLGALLLLSASVPNKAHAIFGIGDIVLDPANLIETVINTYLEGEDFYKEYVLDPLAWVVGKQAAQSVVRSVVSWAGSGFEGEPAFVTDLNQHLLRVGDTVAEDFLRQYLENNAVNSPYRDAVANSIRNDYYRSTGPNAFFNTNQYDLDRYSENPEAFISGDFSQGGWTAWGAAWSNPQNNPIGAQSAAEGALGRSVQTAQETQRAELDWGSGFLASRGNCNSGHTGAAGSASASGRNGTQNTGGVTVTSGTQNTTTTGGVTVTNGGGASGTNTNGVTVTDGSQVSLSGTFDCLLNSTIQTQGATIRASVDKALGSGIDQLVSADEFNEIVGALFSTLVSSVLDEGLSNVSRPSSDGRSTLGNATNGDQLTGSGGNLSNSFKTTIKNQKKQVEGYKEDWEAINRAAMEAKAACGSREPEVDEVLQQSVRELARANEAIAKLSEFEEKASSTQASELEALSTEYRAFLDSGILPTAQEIAQTKVDSVDAPGSGSLLTELKETAKDCLVRRI